MPKDASAIFQSQVGGTYDELERLSALETLKGLRNPQTVTLGDLVGYLSSRGLWAQFAKITLGDLRIGDAGIGILSAVDGAVVVSAGDLAAGRRWLA